MTKACESVKVNIYNSCSWKVQDYLKLVSMSHDQVLESTISLDGPSK